MPAALSIPGPSRAPLLSARRRLAVLAAVCLAVLAINLDTTIVNVALPSISDQLGSTTRELQWIVDGYNLAFAALVLAAGSMGDRFGRRPALLLGLVGFAVASGIGALVGSTGGLVAVRVVMGMFAALIFPTTLSIIANAYPQRRQRAAALGVWGATAGIGVACGPVVGGVLLTHYYWGSVLFALVPVALVAAGWAALVVPESRDRRAPRLDVVGLVLSTATVTLLVWTIIEAPARGWGSAATVVGLMMTVLLGAGFVQVERRRENPMLDVALFRDPRFSAACGAVTVAFFSLFGFIFLITQYFQYVRGYSALSTGTRILPVAASLATASMLGAVLAPRVGTRRVVSSGLLLLGVSFGWISTATATTSYGWSVVPQMLLMGTGLGLVSTPVTESILLVLPPARAGVGSAVNDATRELGGTLGVAVVGSVFASIYSSSLAGSALADMGGQALAAARSGMGAALSVAGGDPVLVAAARSAFIDGLQVGCLIVAGVCLLGAAAAARLLPGRSAVPMEAPPAGAAPVEETGTGVAARA